MKLKIKSPDDSKTYYETTITCNKDYFYLSTTSQVISQNRQQKDPVHSGIYSYFSTLLKRNSRTYGYIPKIWEATFTIGSCPIMIRKSKTRYYINGQVCSHDTLCHALARLTYKSCFEKDPLKLMQVLYST